MKLIILMKLATPCFVIVVLVTSCKLGPDYKKPTLDIPERFKEAGIEWNVIEPKDMQFSSNWFTIFNDSILNELEIKLNKHNYTIQAAENSYKVALALVEKARLSYLPTIMTSSATVRQKQNTSSLANPVYSKTSAHSLVLNASWEPDFWGNISRTIESSMASADSAKAQLASAKLSNQASLAQYYFELRMLDKDQELLDKMVLIYHNSLKYIKNRYKYGIAGEQDIIQANQQLQAAKVLSANNRINRAKYEHAIAALVGKVPSKFTIKVNTTITYPNIHIPLSLPSTVLERRPDIANAERQVAMSSAQIGITKSIFFPNFILSSLLSEQGNGSHNLSLLPVSTWSIGLQIGINLTNLASYKAVKDAAQETYNYSVNLYRNTVLTAFQDVEDNIASLNSLEIQAKIQRVALNNAKENLDIINNQYKAGTVDQSHLFSAEISYYNSEKTLNDLEGLKAITKVALIKALGGV